MSWGGASGQDLGHIRILRYILKMAASLKVIIPDKKETQGQNFPVQPSFKCQMLIVIKYLVLIESRQNLSVA